ncbi:transcriptional regulator, winged helix family [Xylanimonas cellulosilytica DSM 15894]|uniref:Transcriptional regulator, winged helix family n=1 Tax=Xylanimonas cellulosilytica (strain DSM 15894 / JCM 12276 / CECT 5975 / KCTC 9989 / LMG 20990 / NBRC 107835 / XIL07) TaxID=446471 RepID=D1BRC6_XYLCX|nr:BTAD domain-containing putative transcriptional regulator [Xylanimonas cellulosilytica]ACZ30381.1 transcriptional regulator, winged helix family [Xylanimonas cellulosilytica DSM 15894]
MSNRPIEPCVGVLGHVVVTGPDGEARPPRGERSAALLVALALADGRAVPVTSLVDDLWTDGVPADPRAALQSLVSRLRGTAGGAVVVARPGGYALDVATDLGAATAALAAAREALARGACSEAAKVTQEALGLWRGEPGDGLAPAHDSLARTLAGAAGRLRDDLADVRRQAAVALGDHATVAALAAPAVDADATDEVAARDLMTALVALGRRDEAARVYTRLRHALVAELGADPSPETEAIARAASSAPTPAAPARPHQEGPRGPRGLRVAAQPLLGRDADVTALLDAVDRHRLVTILGPGGLGKTRLALEVAGQVLDRAPEHLQVAVAELAGVRTDGDVLLALADAIGISVLTSARLQDRLLAGDVRDQLVERVRSTPMLLVLDNCEHVVAGAADWVAELLAAAPDLRVLTTSRAPLQLAVEQVYAPAPLDASGAGAELFRRRAVAARPGAHLPDDVVVRLVERLDGLPLAIELAAARVRTLSVEEIETHLDERFALLRGGDRSAPERHRTLEAVIAWSWNLLAPSQQALWRRVALLPDGFSVQAAAVIGLLDPGARAFDVLDDLDALVTQSIVVTSDVPGGTRYRMLETVRELGLVRLEEAGELPAVHDALWAWAADLAARRSSELLGPLQVEAMAELGREHENLLFALRAAARPADRPAHGASAVVRPDVVVRLFVALVGQWALQGAEERATQLATAVADALLWWRVPRELREPAALALVFAAMSRGMEGGAVALRLLARLRRVLRDDDADAQGVAVGRRTRIVADLFLTATGRPTEAAMAAAGALRDDADPLLAAMAYLALSQEAENGGRLDESIELATQGYAATLRIGDVASRSFAAMAAASGCSEAGDPVRAREWSSVARAGMAELGTRDAERMLDWIDLASALDLGDLDDAARLCDALDAADADGDGPRGGVEQRAAGGAGRAELAWAHGDRDLALDVYRRTRARVADAEGGAAPWAILVGAAAAVRLTQAGTREEAMDCARDAASRATAFMTVWAARGVDRPVLGTTCVGAGVALALGDEAAPSDVERGLELVQLGAVLGARQDLLALRRGPILAALGERHGDEALAAAAARVAERGHDALTDRAMELLGAL